MMTEFKPDYIITEMQKNVKLAWGGGSTLEDYVPGKNRNMEHVLYIDEKIGTGGLYSESLYFMSDDMIDPDHKKSRDEMMARFAEMAETMKPEEIPGPKPHSHPFDEIFTFFGTDFNHPEDLCGEIEFYLEEEPVMITKSSIGFIPAGMRHCPVNMNRLDRPLFHFSMGFTDSYYHDVLMDKVGAYTGQTGMSKYFVSADKPNQQLPPFRKNFPNGFTHRVAQLDSDVMPETNVHVETAWIWPEHKTGIREGVTFVEEHSHPFQEVISFFGSDFSDIHDLHGEVELWVQGKPYKMNKSFCAVIPEGVEHGPLIVRNVKKPIFHYTVGNAKKYE
jgi:mannose-6-phosphate isomerase-like protein (cupin superfamily)